MEGFSNNAKNVRKNPKDDCIFFSKELAPSIY